jgi:hypothetical protein
MRNLKFLYLSDKEPKTEYLPSPFAKRDCACLCGISFEPTRSDQKYFNKKHADRHYNQVRRKKPSKNQLEVEKQLRLNDKILASLNWGLYQTEKSMKLIYLEARGFDYKVFCGRHKTNDSENYYSLFDFAFLRYESEDGTEMIKIIKI